MKILKFIFIAFLSIGLAGLSGCAKEGPIGPQGPAGPQGEAGPQGPAGNANVKVTIGQVNTWAFDGSVYYADFSAPDITADIGAVQVFMESPQQSGTWLNMPWVEPVTASVFSTYNFIYATGTVRVSKINNNGSAPSNPGVRRFKIVAIASSALIANPGMDWTNYALIKQKFQLAD